MYFLYSYSFVLFLLSFGMDDVFLVRSFEGVSGGELDMFLFLELINDYLVNFDGFGG